MICEDVRAAMGAGELCEETESGARVVTHCLYPSFNPVSVFVTKLGDGYRVSDVGGAVRSAWIHGRDEAVMGRLLAREAARFHLTVVNDALVVSVPGLEWLRSAILAVANASASVAEAAVARVAVAAEMALKSKIFVALGRVASPNAIGTNVEVIGSSGDARHFDYGVKTSDEAMLLVNAVAPHHSSIYAKYVAFADIKELDHGLSRFAVYDRPLDRGDVSLMLQVADLVPLAALDPRARTALRQ